MCHSDPSHRCRRSVSVSRPRKGPWKSKCIRIAGMLKLKRLDADYLNDGILLPASSSVREARFSACPCDGRSVFSPGLGEED